MKQKKVASCDGPDIKTVYISEDVEDCPCPWNVTCHRVRVRGPGYAGIEHLEKYG